MAGDPKPSPVEAPASGVAQGWKYLSGRQKATILGLGATATVIGMMVWSSHRHHVATAPPKPEPIASVGVDEPFKPPAFPQPVSALVPIRPAAPAVGPIDLVKPGVDPTKSAYDSDIGAIGGNSAEGGSVAPAGTGRAGSGVTPVSLDDLPGKPGGLADRLKPTEMNGTKASELPNPDFLISQGRLIPCELQTAIDTTFPGLVRATIPTPVYSDTGNVILFDKGSKVVGTMEQAIINGLNRQFVLWTRITTPPMYDRNGVPHEYAIKLDSPAVDEVGATGLDGDVNTHLWKKLSGAVMLSVLSGAIQIGTSAVQQPGTSNLNISQAGSGLNNLPSQLLSATINIPDVLHRNQGTTCAIFVARDLEVATYNLRGRG